MLVSGSHHRAHADGASPRLSCSHQSKRSSHLCTWVTVTTPRSQSQIFIPCTLTQENPSMWRWFKKENCIHKLVLTPQPLCSRCEGSRTGKRWYEARGSSWLCLRCGPSGTPLHPSHRPTQPGCNQLETSGLLRQQSAHRAKAIYKWAWVYKPVLFVPLERGRDLSPSCSTQLGWLCCDG